MKVAAPPRTFTVGGSDAAAVAGVDPYRSAVMAWAEKTGRIARDDSEAMAWGRILEPVVLAEVENRGHAVVPSPSDGFRDPEFPWMVGHPDGFTASDGERAVLEVKTASPFAWPKDSVPVHYQAQCQWYMMLTGCPSAVVAALVGGQRLELHELRRDDSAISLLRLLAAEFYEHLRRDRPPTPDGSDSAREALRELYPGAQAGKVYRLSRDEWWTVKELRQRKAQLDTVKGQVAGLENRLKLAMGDAEHAISPHDEDVIRWTNVNSTRLDTAALKAARPDVHQEFSTTTATRRFTLL